MFKTTALIVILCLAPFLSGAEEIVPPERIISLAPNVTEILFGMGLSERIAGVTTFCDYPEEANKKPKIGGMSNPSLEAVVSLKPDIVVMTTDGNPKEFEERLRAFGIKTYVLRARRIHELPDELRALGSALGAEKEAEQLAGRLSASIEKSQGGDKPGKRVLFIVWPEPLMVAGFGTAIDDAITLLGYINIASMQGVVSSKSQAPVAPYITGARSPYPKYSVEEVIRQAPDIILIGGGMSSEDIGQLSERLLERLKSTPAVRDKKVFFLSDSLYRLGPRLTQGIEELEEALRR